MPRRAGAAGSWTAPRVGGASGPRPRRSGMGRAGWRGRKDFNTEITEDHEGARRVLHEKRETIPAPDRKRTARHDCLLRAPPWFSAISVLRLPCLPLPHANAGWRTPQPHPPATLFPPDANELFMIAGLDGEMCDDPSDASPAPNPRRRIAAMALRLSRFTPHAVPWAGGAAPGLPPWSPPKMTLLDPVPCQDTPRPRPFRRGAEDHDI